MSAPTPPQPAGGGGGGGRKRNQNQEEPVYEVLTPPTPPVMSSPLLPPAQNQPQLAPLGKRNIVKVDPNAVRRAIYEKYTIPTRSVVSKDVQTLSELQERVNSLADKFAKDLKTGSLQLYGTPYNADDLFQKLVGVLADRFFVLASDVVESKMSEIQAMLGGEADYNKVIQLLNEMYETVAIFLLAFARSILEVAGVSGSKIFVEYMSPLEVAQMLGVTPIRTDKL